jgi:hypothetical protein
MSGERGDRVVAWSSFRLKLTQMVQRTVTVCLGDVCEHGRKVNSTNIKMAVSRMLRGGNSHVAR